MMGLIPWCVAIEMYAGWLRFWGEAMTRGYEAEQGPGAEIIDFEEWKARHAHGYPERAA